MEEEQKGIKPTNKVIRRIFEEPSAQEREAERITQEQEAYGQNEERKVKYNFDVLNDKPLQLPNSRFANWERVTETNNKSSKIISKLPR